MMKLSSPLDRPLAALLLVPVLAACLLGQAPPARAADADASLAASSGLSLLPVAVVVAAPASVLVGGAALTVVAVEAAADGSTWVVERASDGARASLRVAGAGSVLVGTAITVTVVGTGWLLSSAGRVVAWVPNEAGRRLSHHARVSR